MGGLLGRTLQQNPLGGLFGRTLWKDCLGWGTMAEISRSTLFNDPTRDSIANDFVIGVYCRCLQILYQITFSIKSKVISYATKCNLA